MIGPQINCVSFFVLIWRLLFYSFRVQIPCKIRPPNRKELEILKYIYRCIEKRSHAKRKCLYNKLHFFLQLTANTLGFILRLIFCSFRAQRPCKIRPPKDKELENSKYIYRCVDKRRHAKRKCLYNQLHFFLQLTSNTLVFILRFFEFKDPVKLS